MFRRRPLRRRPLLRRPPPRARTPAVAARVRSALNRAHHALERGETAQAEQIFTRLAKGFARRGMPVRAAVMALEAAQAGALGGRAGQAVEHAGRALAFFSHTPLPERVAATAERVVTALRQGGHEAEAAEVERMLEDTLQKGGTTRQELASRFAAARAQRRGRLPGKCPSCGGPMLPDEVAWHGPDAAECPYCGSVVEAE